MTALATGAAEEWSSRGETLGQNPAYRPSAHRKNTAGSAPGAVDSAVAAGKRRASKEFAEGPRFSDTGETTMAKPATIKIRLNSTAGTGHFYVTKKNARTMTEKFTVKKYDPVKREHVEYKEGKIK